MPHFKKAHRHHGHVGRALKAGNANLAMHHVGHMMAALRRNDPEEALEAEPTAPVSVAQSSPMPNPVQGLMSRLSSFTKRG